MPWDMPWFENIKKKSCRYLLQRYLGQFFREKLTLDRLSLDLYNGTGTVSDVSLDVHSLNELGEQQSLPFEFLDGYAENVSVTVPWSALLSESCIVHVHGLNLTVQPTQREDEATSLLESMWSCMTSSLQLAQECLQQEDGSDNARPPPEGLELFASTIDSILSRVQVTFTDTLIRFEHVPKGSTSGVALEIFIRSLEFLDEAGNDPPSTETTEFTAQDHKKSYVVTSFNTKKLSIEGVAFRTDEFATNSDTRSSSQSPQNDTKESKDSDNEQYYPVKESFSEESTTNEDTHEPVTFAKLIGRQEVLIKSKQSEKINGPKIDIKMTLGTLMIYLTPRQLHALIELGNGFVSPEEESNPRCVQKLMTNSDYRRVEADLQAQMQPLAHLQGSGLQNLHGWSTASIGDDSDNDFEPHTFNDMGDSVLSTATSLESITSTASSQTTSSRSSRQTYPRRRDSDITSDIWHLELRVASVIMILLHEDLLIPSADNTHPVNISSIRKLIAKSKHFFDQLSVANFGFGKGIPEGACSSNHLRLQAAPVRLECTQQSSNNITATIGATTVAKFELLECLVTNDLQTVELLCFNNDRLASQSSKPNIVFTFKQSQRSVRTFQGKKRAAKTKLRFELDECRSEFDITMTDRLNALLNPHPLFSSGEDSMSQRNTPYLNQTDTSIVYKFDTDIFSPALALKLRIPIPDLRPKHDMQRCPYWQRNIRSDYLELKFTEPYFNYSTHSKQPATNIELTTTNLDIYYYFKDTMAPLHVGGAKTAHDLPDKISLVIHIYPYLHPNPDLDESSGADSDPLSIFDGFQPSKIPSPFSCKRVVHQSDTPHSKTDDETHEELVIPGNKQEIEEFCNYATKTSRIQVQLFFPNVSVQLDSKHVLETIYNRISSDLLFWESSAPKMYSDPYDPYGCTDLRESIHPAFSMCKSGIQYDSDESGESDDNGFPYNISESRKTKQKPEKASGGQSNISISLNIVDGLLHMFTPVRDTSGNVIPCRQGEFFIRFQNVKIFSVSSFRGNVDLGYVCLQSDSVYIHHCGLVEMPHDYPALKDVHSIPGSHLLPTIYPMETGMNQVNRDLNTNGMLTVAIKIQSNHEIHQMKVIKIACSIKHGVLRVNIAPSENTWLTQLQDMFDITDYPIEGYKPSTVLTELHLHVWTSGMDYRPLNLPLRAFITLGSFSMSSNLVAQTRTNTLRIITEDCALLLSNKCKNKLLQLCDYVCVIELGLFELSLRYSDKPRSNNPQMDLRASNNMIHIRTCADSGRALLQLLEYLAMDGDLPVSVPETSNSDLTQDLETSDVHSSNSSLVPVGDVQQQICDISKSQHERVIEDLCEAMKENAAVINTDEPVDKPLTGVKMFFFPDEDAPLPPIDTEFMSTLPQVTRDLGDTTTYVKPTPPKRSDTDDEYDIIEKDIEIEDWMKHDHRVIWHITDHNPRWIKNFDAIPVGKSDLLNAPKSFPTPISRYTLCEMNLIWHMFGGKDFNENEKQKTVNFAETATFKKDGENVKFTSTEVKKAPTLHSWKTAGGPERNHDVLMEFQLNKVRFRHELYPEEAKQASRQMLLISEVEIRDRLASSQINKFLYQYTTEARPKRAQTNMVIVKQLFVRPDLHLKREESILRVSLLPLRLNIDQDALLFLISFFSELCGNPTEPEKTSLSTSLIAQTSRHNTPTHQRPIMTVATTYQEESTDDTSSVLDTEEAQKLISDNLLILLEDDLMANTNPTPIPPPQESSDIRPPVYFRDIRFDSEVSIRIDYHGKRVDMSGPGGALAGLLMGIGQLNCSEIKLRRFRYRHGILGFEKLVSYALHEWLTDIKKNQLPGLLGGVGPMYALVKLFQGIRDLFWLPIEQYKKDGRIVHGLQRGANSFTTSTAMAAIELTLRIIYLIQSTAETAYDMVSPGPSVKRRIRGKKGRRKYNHQPQDFREGVTNAYILMKEGIEETALNLALTAKYEHEQKGYTGALGGILRQIPPTVVKPIILASEATNNVLGGMVSELVPEIRKDNLQKWRTEES